MSRSEAPIPRRALVTMALLAGAACPLPGCQSPPSPGFVDAGEVPDAASPDPCDGCAWTQRQRLVAADGLRGDRFGDRVALDGDLAVVSSKNHDLGDLDEGAVYVYERNVDGWRATAKLIASDPDRDDELGRAVAVSGTTIAVAAWQDDEAGDEAGAVYVFEKRDGSWSQSAKLMAGAAGALFGRDVALDGDVLAVGAYHDGPDERGAVYVFERDGAGWSQVARLQPPDLAAGAHLGEALALRGSTLLTGAPGGGAGAVYVFERDAAGWRARGTLERPADLPTGDAFGHAVAMSDAAFVVGVRRSAAVPGIAYAYARDATGWRFAGALVASETVAADRFGEVVAADGDFVMIGAYDARSSATTNAGAVHVFQPGGAGWVATGTLGANQPVANESVGISLAIRGDTMVVGGAGDVAYVFERL